MDSSLSSAWPRNVLILFSLLMFLQMTECYRYHTTADYYSLGVMVYEMSVSAHHFRKIRENQNGSLFMTIHSENPDFPITGHVHLNELIAMVSIHTALPSLYRQNPFQVIWTFLGVQNTQLYILPGTHSCGS